MADTNAAAPPGDATQRLVKSLQDFNGGMDPAALAATAHPVLLKEAQRLLVNAADLVAWALRSQRQKVTGKLHITRKPQASLVHLLVDAGCPRRGAEKMSYDEAVAMLGGNYFAQMLVDKVRAAPVCLPLLSQPDGGSTLPLIAGVDSVTTYVLTRRCAI